MGWQNVKRNLHVRNVGMSQPSGLESARAVTIGTL